MQEIFIPIFTKRLLVLNAFVCALKTFDAITVQSAIYRFRVGLRTYPNVPYQKQINKYFLFGKHIEVLQVRWF